LCLIAAVYSPLGEAADILLRTAGLLSAPAAGVESKWQSRAVALPSKWEGYSNCLPNQFSAHRGVRNPEVGVNGDQTVPPDMWLPEADRNSTGGKFPVSPFNRPLSETQPFTISQPFWEMATSRPSGRALPCHKSVYQPESG
jgi:hypothetical protein